MTQRKLIRFVFPELQRRLIAVALACVGSSMVIGVCVTAVALNRLASVLPNDGDVIVEKMPWALTLSAGVGLAIALPVFALITLSMTMPLMGVLFRLKTFLTGTVDGTQVEECKLRDKDPLKDLCSLLNQATVEQRRSNGEGAESATASQKAA